MACFSSIWIPPVIKELLTISRINWDKGDDNDFIREIGNGSRKYLEWQLFIRWTIVCTEGVQNEESEQLCEFIKWLNNYKLFKCIGDWSSILIISMILIILVMKNVMKVLQSMSSSILGRICS